MRRITTTVLGLAAATSMLSGLTACGSSPADTSGQPTPGASTGAATSGSPSTASPSTTSPSTTSQPAPSTTDAADVKVPAFPSGTGEQSANSKGWDLVLSGVRVGTHDGFDRVVVEFKGRGTPGWGVKYVTTPRSDGSGEVVDLHGDSFLGVSIEGVTLRKGYPKTPADFFHGARHFAPEHGGAIEDVNVGGVFEGYSQLFLGLDGEKVPFRVFALRNPSRLVIDVKDA